MFVRFSPACGDELAAFGSSGASAGAGVVVVSWCVVVVVVIGVVVLELCLERVCGTGEFLVPHAWFILVQNSDTCSSKWDPKSKSLVMLKPASAIVPELLPLSEEELVNLGSASSW